MKPVVAIGNNAAQLKMEQGDRVARLSKAVPTVPKPRLEGIQICRGVAALLVLLFHVTQLSQVKLGQPFLGNRFAFGSAGVDFFFVLSGFIIFFVHRTDFGRPDRLRSFVLKRLIRIYPLYWIITLAILPFYFFAPQFGYGYERNLATIAKSLFLVPQTHLPVLIVGWSLSHEMLFYSIAALAILLPLQRSRPLLSGWLLGTIALFLSQTIGGFELQDHGLIQFIFNPHNLEFALGCFAAYAVYTRLFKLQSTFFLLLGLSLFFLVGFTQVERSIGIHPIIGYGISSMLIVVGAASLDLRRSRSLLRPFTYLGDASYSIYLTHYPCLSVLLKLALTANVSQLIGYPATVCLLILTTVSIGCLTYFLLEKPLVNYLRRTILNQPSIVRLPFDSATSKKAMKILFLDQSGELAGAELCLLDLVQSYRERCLVCLFGDGPFRAVLQEQAIAVEVLAAKPMQVRKESGFLQGFQSLGQLLPLVAKVVRLSRDYDVIYANTQKALVVGALASVLGRRPLVYHLHDILSPDHFSATNRRLAVTLANRCASRVIATSNASRDAFIEAGGHSEIISVVYNGFDPAIYQQSTDSHSLRHQLGLEGNFVVGHFSRLSPWKGQHVLIDALVDCPDDVTAVFVGDALFGEQDYVQTLKTQVETLGLHDRVRFLGFRSDVVPLMQICDVVAHTSIAPEPFGRVIAEAMLCERPIIASASGGAVELVESGVTGWLLPPGDARSLADAIIHCRQHPESVSAITQAAQAEATQRFNINHVRRQIEQLLQAVVRGKE